MCGIATAKKPSLPFALCKDEGDGAVFSTITVSSFYLKKRKKKGVFTILGNGSAASVSDF